MWDYLVSPDFARARRAFVVQLPQLLASQRGLLASVASQHSREPTAPVAWEPWCLKLLRAPRCFDRQWRQELQPVIHKNGLLAQSD
jgi:hypothetical protein